MQSLLESQTAWSKIPLPSLPVSDISLTMEEDGFTFMAASFDLPITKRGVALKNLNYRFAWHDKEVEYICIFKSKIIQS